MLTLDYVFIISTLRLQGEHDRRKDWRKAEAAQWEIKEPWKQKAER